MAKIRVLFLIILLIPLSPYPTVSSLERETVYDDALSYYQSLVGTNWQEFRNPGDDQLYYSVAGGIAGLGMQLLRTNGTLSLTEQVANDLLGFAQVNNATHTIWSVSDNTTEIDLGYDFGLSGIAAFYSKLALVTQNTTYTAVAYRIYSSILDLSTVDTKISWETNLTYLDGNYWYAFDYFTDQMDFATYTGRAFGPVGLGVSILDYVEAPGANLTFAREVLDLVNTFLAESSIDIEGYSVLPITVGDTVVSNSRALGVSGIGEYYFNYLQFDNDSLIQSRLEGMISWLLDGDNYLGNLYDETIDLESYWTGLELGISGNLRFLSLTYDSLNSTQQGKVLNLWNLISLLREGINGGLGFPEYVNNGQKIDLTSSLAYGTAGIVETLLGFEQLVNQTKELNRLDLYRTSILNSIANFSAGLYYPVVDEYGHGASVGLAGVLYLFTISTLPLVTVSVSSVNFGEVEIGETSLETVVITNIGFSMANISVNGTTDEFSTNMSDFTLDAGKSVPLNLVFTPQNETALTNVIFLLINNASSIGIQVSGQGIDSPSITSLGLGEGSVIEGTVDLTFNITDSSLIKEVKLKILDGNGESVLSTTLDSTTSTYIYSWDTKTVENANYTIVVSAVDIHDRIGELRVDVEVVNPVTKPTDFLSSDVFIYSLVGAIVILAVIGTVQTVNTMRKSKVTGD